MTAVSTLIVGTQFGDEGKGKVVDLLVDHQKFDVVVRYNGGANAGHTIVTEKGTFPLHLVPSGILHPDVKNVVGTGVVLEPAGFVKELETLKKAGIDCKNLWLSDRLHLVMPWHKSIDAHLGGKIGTTARGIGPCYEDRASRRGIRMGDLINSDKQVDRETFSRRFREVAAEKNLILEKVYGLAPIDTETALEDILTLAEQLKSMVTDTASLLDQFQKQGLTTLFEGAQGCLLDLDWGSYPYVTSSSVGIAGCYLGSGTAQSPTHCIGITKAYSTRVGEGPYPAELGDYETIKVKDQRGADGKVEPLTEEQKKAALAGDEFLMGSWLRRAGREFGTTTGRPRRTGWLDIVAVRHSIRFSGITEIAMTKLDVLSDIPTLKICTGYKYRGQVLDTFPSRAHVLAECEAIYEELEGFGPLDHVKDPKDLPPAALAFLKRVEELAGIPVSVLSVGPHRAQSMFMGDR